MKNYRLLYIVMIVVLLGSAIYPAAAPASAQSTCDPTAYINSALADVQTVDGLMKTQAVTSAAAAADSYLKVAEIRRKYEDMALVPSCATVLHSLVLQWFSAAQDEIALVLSIFADRPNTERYSRLRLENQNRLNTLADAATAEISRLRGVSSAGTPQSAADWYRVYFSQVINSDNPADHHGAFIEQSLIFVIDHAQKTIDAALFEINAPDLTAALIRALGRGVRIRLVVDDEHALHDPESTINDIIAAGAQVRDDARSALMHHKFYIIDSTDIWTGSTNMTRNGFYNNNNNSMLIRSPELVANYQNEFDEMFIDGNFSRSQDSRNVPYPDVLVNGVRIETFFAPEQGREIVARLIQLTGESQRSIRVMAFSYTLSDLGTAMINRIQNGVRVDAVFETVGSTRGQMPRLGCAGANVRQDGNPDIMHHKVIIFDDQTVAMGSFNFSASARDSNSENILIIHDPTIASYYLAEFQARFNEGSVPSLSC